MESDSDEGLKGDVPSNLDFNRMRHTITTAGYREGAGAGKDAAFQAGFDKGFAEGFKTGYALGTHNGVIETLKSNPSLSCNDGFEARAFPDSKLGLCQLCNNSSKEPQISGLRGSSDHISSTTENAIMRQRQVTRSSLEEKKSSTSQLLQNTDLNDLLESINKTYYC